MSSCLCDSCAALCCRYFALPIDNPDCERDYDNIRWYLLHQNVVIFVESKQWYIGVLNRCKQLQPDNRCGIYLTRPAICRSYTTDNCDYHAGDYGYEHLFTSADALWEFALKTLAQERAKNRSKKQAKSKARTALATRARQLSKGLPMPQEVPQIPVGLQPPASGRTLALPLLKK